MKPLVSILVAAYNAEKYIAEALDSCLAQTYSPIEIIVINDGSKDNTEKIALEYAAKDNRIKVFSHPNAGVIATRNRSLSIATGEWAMILDADDVLYPQAITEQMQFISKNPLVTAVGAWSEDIGEDNKNKAFRLYKQPDNLSTPSQFQCYQQEQKLIEGMRHSGTIFCREIVVSIGGYTRGQILEDLYLWNQLASLGYMVLVNPLVLTKYRFHGNSIMSKQAYDIHINYKWIRSTIYRTKETVMSFDDYKKWYKKQSWWVKSKDAHHVYTNVYARKVLISLEKKSYINAVSQLIVLFFINPLITIKKATKILKTNK